MSHAQKKLNDELTNVVSALPSSERYLFAEMKEEMNEMALVFTMVLQTTYQINLRDYSLMH